MTWCSSTPQENNPDVAFPYESHHPYERKNPESRVVVLYLNEFEKRHIFRASPVSCCWWLKTFFGRADFDVCVRFENIASVEDARRHDGSWQPCMLLLALSRYDRRVLRVLLRCAELIALSCAVLAVDGRVQNMLLIAQQLGVLCDWSTGR